MSDDVMSAEEARAWRDDGVDGNRDEIARLCDTIIALHERVDLNRAAWLNTREEMNELYDAEKARADKAEAERNALRSAAMEYRSAVAAERGARRYGTDAEIAAATDRYTDASVTLRELLDAMETAKGGA